MTVLDFTIRKRAELRRKLASLDRELATWRALSEVGQPLEKHHTQIRRTATALSALRDALDSRIVQSDPRSDAQSVESALQEVHHLWAFFRGALAQRLVTDFQPLLAAADDYAWACYRPIRDRLADAAALREPPLVYLNGGTSPFALPRGAGWLAEAVPGAPWAVQALERLPIPVVGVPWYQVGHLPELLVVAHEVGHVVEVDAGLAPALARRLAAAAVAPANRAWWQRWRAEVFADLFGALAAGPAFAGALHDFLAVSPLIVAGVPLDPQGVHPPESLRVRLAAEVARRQGFATDAVARWDAAYPVRRSAQPFEGDVEAVVAALLDAPYEELSGATLADAVGYTADQHAAADRDARLLAARAGPDGRDVRALVAAAHAAFVGAPEDWTETTQRRALEAISRARETGVRAGARGAPAAPPDDEALGRALAADLLAT